MSKRTREIDGCLSQTKDDDDNNLLNLSEATAKPPQSNPLQQQPIAPVCSGPLVMAHAVRFAPGSDLVSSLEYAARQSIQSCGRSSSNACFVVTAVGSLSSCTLRMASAPQHPGTQLTRTTDTVEKQQCCGDQHLRTWDNENLEIVSLVGTLNLSKTSHDNSLLSSIDVSKHLHLSISDSVGNCYGGHLISGTIYTTLELILGTISNVQFDRVYDPSTGYRELQVSSFTT